MMRGWWGRAPRKLRIRAVELGAALAIIGIVVWHYEGLAPQVIVVLSFWLSLFAALVQLPFLAGYYGIRRFRPLLIASVAGLPFLIALGYGVLYGRNLFLLWYWEWLGGIPRSTAVLVVAALPALSFGAGLMNRKMRGS